jgi:GDP-D-mannose dehydratase
MTVDTILVTGAFGQIGKRCAQILLDRGRTVIAVDLRNDKTVAVEQELSADAPSGALIPAYVDLTDAEGVRGLIATHQPEPSFTLRRSSHHCRTETPHWPERSTSAVPETSSRQQRDCHAHRFS